MVEEFHDTYETAMDSKYALPLKRLGAPTSPMTANQITQLGQLLNQGIKNVEIGTIDPKQFETIPKQHFEEMRRVAKLTGAEPSIHAPLIDLSGFSQQGWDESHRVAAEKQAVSIMERAHQLNPDGNIPVNFHTSQAPAFFWQKNLKEGEKLAMGIVDQDTGQINMLKYEEKTRFGEPEKEIWTPEKSLENLNRTKWEQDKLQLMEFQKRIDELSDRKMRFEQANKHLELGAKHEVLNQQEQAEYMRNMGEIQGIQNHISQLHSHMHSGFDALYHKFDKFSDEKLRKTREYQEFVHHVYPNMKQKFDFYQGEINKKHSELIKMQVEARHIPREEQAKYGELFQQKSSELHNLRGQQTNELVKDLVHLPAPEIFKSIDEFALEKASRTVSNVMFEAFKKFGAKTPTMVLENFAPELPLSRAENLKEAVEKSRKEFAERLVKERGFDTFKAEETAKKLIGATWDLGHINLLRKGGFTEKEIEEETRRIAKAGIVKHVHVADNFGFEDSHLPPGMGTIDNKKLLEELEKGGFKGKAIMEAGAFAKEFEASPTPYVLQGAGVSLYSDRMAPYWKWQEVHGAYYGGMGPILPAQHFDLYGAGFSMAALPMELGGQIPGKQNRFAGTPME